MSNDVEMSNFDWVDGEMTPVTGDLFDSIYSDEEGSIHEEFDAIYEMEEDAKYWNILVDAYDAFVPEGSNIDASEELDFVGDIDHLF